MGATDQLEHIEKASVDELRALQFERLKWSVRHAYENVPHYRRKFEAHRVRPDDLKHLEDLAKFPFTTKQDLRENYPFGMFAVPLERIVRIHASSGTTGRPTVVGYTKPDIDTWSHVMARSIRAAGGRSTDKIHVAYGYGLFTGGLGAHYGGETLGACVIPLGGGMTERQVQLINDFKPDIIMVTPSYMLAIADEFERQGLDAKRSSLRVGIFGAEPWTEGMREEIERRMGLDRRRPLRAVGGDGAGRRPGVHRDQGRAHDLGGSLLSRDRRPRDRRGVPDGKRASCVFTSLTKEALPVIRYRTRDLTTLLPGTARTMRRMARISGRSDDMLIIRGVNVFPTQIEELITRQRELAPHYVLEVRREGRLDALDVIVEARGDLSAPLTEAERAGEAKPLEHHVKSYIGVTTTVKVVEPGKVERSQGKAKRVIDLRPKT